jgi:four helix bundle protein
MSTKPFEELRVWQEAMDLTQKVFLHFKTSKEYWIKDQILRSSLSIPSNIAEGHDRTTTKEYMHYLTIARASCSEVRTQLIIAKQSEIIGEPNGLDLLKRSKKITAMLNKELSYLNSIK